MVPLLVTHGFQVCQAPLNQRRAQKMALVRFYKAVLEFHPLLIPGFLRKKSVLWPHLNSKEAGKPVSVLLPKKKKCKSLSHVPTLCDPVDYAVHRILQATILEWVAFLFSRTSSQPRDQTQVSHTAGEFFTSWITRDNRNRFTDLENELMVARWKDGGKG